VITDSQVFEKVLICEACTHHRIGDDIGREKIPRWLRAEVGPGLQCDVVAGHDFPDNLEQYALVIHCGACMFNRRAMLSRIMTCQRRGVAITNYGIVIAYLHGILDRVLVPFLGGSVQSGCVGSGYGLEDRNRYVS